MPDYQTVYNRLTAFGSKANLFTFGLSIRLSIRLATSTRSSASTPETLSATIMELTLSAWL